VNVSNSDLIIEEEAIEKHRVVALIWRLDRVHSDLAAWWVANNG
jgi:hypothetical protein